MKKIKLSEEIGFTVLGMIGSLFLAEQGWMLDSAHQEIIIPDSDVSMKVFLSIRSHK